MRPKPVMSVQAWGPTCIIASEALLIKGGHGVDRSLQHIVGYDALLGGGGNDSGAEGLGEDELVAGSGTGVGYLLAGGDGAYYCHAVLGFLVVHGMAADDEAGGFLGLGVAPFQDVPQDFPWAGCWESRRC